MSALYKRGSTWWVRVSIGGKQIRRSAKTTSKVEAAKFMRQMIEEETRKAASDGVPKHTVKEAIQRFFIEATVKKGTRRTYTSNSRNWLDAGYGDLTLDQIDRHVISDFVKIRKEAGVTDTTIRRDIAFLGTVLSMCISWGWIDTNPVTALSKRFLKESPPRTRFLSRAEFNRLYAVASADLKPIMVFAVETGMRKEEILSLTVDALDLRRREVHLQETKTNSPRRVPLSDKAIEVIAELLARPNRPQTKYLFCKTNGTRFLCNKVGFKAACERAGIEDFRFHDLRHTFASWWVQAGGDMYKLSRVLGHKQLQMTARYGHLRTDDLHSEIDRVAQKQAQERKTTRRSYLSETENSPSKQAGAVQV